MKKLRHMLVRALVAGLFVVSSLLLATANAPAVESSPMRKLVYSFQRAIDENITVKMQPSPQGWQQQAAEKQAASRENQQFVVSGDAIPQSPGDEMEQTDAGSKSVPGGTVGGHAAGESSGTIEVDVLRQQADRGLVVSIHEQSKSADATPVTCVVYPNTSLACDSQQNVRPEEYALLRFLGQGFVDPSQMDAQRKWHIAQNGGGLESTSDYQIVGDSGGDLTIDERQTIGSKTGTATTIRSTIDYDFNRSLPTSIDERVLQSQESGAQNTARSVRTVLRLVSATP